MPPASHGSSNGQDKTAPHSLLDTAPFPALRPLRRAGESTPPADLPDELEAVLLATWHEMAQDPELRPWVQAQLEEYRVVMGYPPGWQGTEGK